LLENSFIHIPGVGAHTERSLWRQGCLHWDDLLANPTAYRFGTTLTADAASFIEASQSALQHRNHQFFRQHLGLAEGWRAWQGFRDRTVYLDIETDGGQSGNSITTIGLYDGKDFRCLVKGEDLGAFPDIVSHYSQIVTFFGNGFDLPMLRKKFPHVVFDQIHIDLCPTLKRLGHRGGLKKIEIEIGLTREEQTQGLTGLDAIRLWRKWERAGDAEALETLIAYNREDVVNLEWLANYAFERLCAATFQWDNESDTPRNA